MRRATAALLQRLPHPVAHPVAAAAGEAGTGGRPHRHARRRSARARAGVAGDAGSSPHGSTLGTARPALKPSPAATHVPAAQPAPAAEAPVVIGDPIAAPQGHTHAHEHADPAVSALDLRAREAGGPMDNASYNCACGFVFAAAVSTTVSCPHCGAGQAW